VTPTDPAASRPWTNLVPSPVRAGARLLLRTPGYARLALIRRWLLRARGGAQPLPPRLSPAPRLLFVCHGNILRSAVAEALTTRLVGEGLLPAGSRAASAGTHAIAGRAADPRGQVVARELGVSLEAHRSQPLSEGLVGEADLVLAMDLINEAEIAARFPWAEPKLRLLGAFGGGSAVISDPYMGDEEAVRAAFRSIAHCLDAFAGQIKARGVLTERDAS